MKASILSYLGCAAVLASLSVACGDDTTGDGTSSGTPSGSSGGGGESSGGDCKSECVAHEKDCGDTAPEAKCGQVCDTYKPLAWEVACAKKVSCGDDAGLIACMPDLECQSKCVAHEKDCGDPSPEAGCKQLCDEFRPIVSQVACAQKVACGDQQGLSDCIEPPN